MEPSDPSTPACQCHRPWAAIMNLGLGWHHFEYTNVSTWAGLRSEQKAWSSIPVGKVGLGLGASTV